MYYWYPYFRNPATAGADQLGKYMISALVAFVLVSLFNAYRMKKIRQGRFRTSRPKSPRKKVALLICGVFVLLLLLMILGIYAGRI